MRRFAAAIFASIILAVCVAFPAQAQWDQSTGPFTASGSTNAYVITVPNATQYSDLTGVLIKWVPNAANTGSATLQVDGNSGALTGSAPTLMKTSGTGLTALTGGSPAELQTGQPLVVMLDANGNFDIMSSLSANPTVTAAVLQKSALAFSEAPNLAIQPSVGSNQLTLSICINSSTPPTCTPAAANSPIPILFRDPTIANGDPVLASLAAAQGFTIGSGNTMGCTSGNMCRLRLYEINNAGTLGLCAYNSLSGTSIVPLDETSPQTSASGTAGGSSAQTLYCNISSVSAKAVREIGYVDVEETTAGTWAALPTVTQLLGPTTPRAGQTVGGPLYNSTNASTSGTPSGYTVSAVTPPAPANGISLIAQAITPKSAADVIVVHVTPNISQNDSSSGNMGFLYLYNGTSTLKTVPVEVPINISNTVFPLPVSLEWRGIIGGSSTSAITFTGYYTSDASQPVYINQTDYAASIRNITGGTAATSIEVTEIAP